NSDQETCCIWGKIGGIQNYWPETDDLNMDKLITQIFHLVTRENFLAEILVPLSLPSSPPLYTQR
ncbi:hypothetical protein KFY57_27135, partial [Salmonella enterica subsp. enterica serovar Typhimurium]|nr:hypothetical protein [Salmonella enterica subsp. enterica serovar Typhimurium]